MIDSKLNWSNHINHVSLKISKGLGVISRLRNALPLHILLTLYYTLIYPYLSYCNVTNVSRFKAYSRINDGTTDNSKQDAQAVLLRY